MTGWCVVFVFEALLFIEPPCREVFKITSRNNEVVEMERYLNCPDPVAPPLNRRPLCRGRNYYDEETGENYRVSECDMSACRSEEIFK